MHCIGELMLPMAAASWYVGAQFPPKHYKQITNGRGHCIFKHGLFNRLIFGMVDIYDRLDQEFVDSPSIQSFQKKLTIVAKTRCAAGVQDWKYSFSSTHRTSYVSALESGVDS